MVNLGRFNKLKVVRQLPRGVQLDGGRVGEILLPKQYIQQPLEVGEEVNVFVYRDSEDRFIATTTTPKAQVGEFAYLNVTDVTKIGAFLDWGLPKDLLVPFAEQLHTRLTKGRQALVRVYVDDSNRLAASAKIDSFLHDTDENDHFKAGEKVSILIAGSTDLGIKVIVNDAYWGLIYHSDVFEKLHRGDRRDGYVKRIRPDKKLEISIQAPGFNKALHLSEKILHKLQNVDGFLELNDKSRPEDIKAMFKCSKSAFKQAIGHLYKERKIRIEKNGIYLAE
jgi:predicted RNA-binding protein (virulence factor B family)